MDNLNIEEIICISGHDYLVSYLELSVFNNMVIFL